VKLKLRAAIDGILELSKPNEKLTIEHDGLLFEVEANEQRRATHVSVTGPIPQERASTVSAIVTPPDAAGAGAAISMHTDSETTERLTSALQMIESRLSFMSTSIERVRWHEPEESLIPETPEEEVRVSLSSISVKTGSRRRPQLLTENRFNDTVRTLDRFSELNILQSFSREGFNFLDNGQFVQAFYSYYFVIEDLYADGKTGEKPVMTAFAGNEEYCQVCAAVLQSFSSTRTGIEPKVRHWFEKMECQYDVPGLQRLLFRLRGNLHHYFGKSSRPHATPFNQKDFEPVAVLMMHTATLAVLFRIVAINNRDNAADSSTT